MPAAIGGLIGTAIGGAVGGTVAGIGAAAIGGALGSAVGGAVGGGAVGGGAVGGGAVGGGGSGGGGSGGGVGVTTGPTNVTTGATNVSTTLNNPLPTYVTTPQGQILIQGGGMVGALTSLEQQAQIQQTGASVAATENTFGATQPLYQSLLASLMTNPNFIQQSPLYQSEMNAGTQAVNTGLAQMGLTNSGQQQLALQKVGQNTVSSIFNQYAGLLPGLAMYGSSPQAAGNTTMSATQAGLNYQSQGVAQGDAAAQSMGQQLSQWLGSPITSGGGTTSTNTNVVGQTAGSFLQSLGTNYANSSSASTGTYDPITNSYTAAGQYNPITGAWDSSSTPQVYQPGVTYTSSPTPLAYTGAGTTDYTSASSLSNTGGTSYSDVWSNFA